MIQRREPFRTAVAHSPLNGVNFTISTAANSQYSPSAAYYSTNQRFRTEDAAKAVKAVRSWIYGGILQ